MKFFMPTLNKGIRKLIHKKYDTITINECNKSKKCCDCYNNLEYHKNKEGNNIYRLLKCVSCENKKTVFKTRDVNSSINIMNLTKMWIKNQKRPLQFKISSFTCKQEKVRLS